MIILKAEKTSMVIISTVLQSSEIVNKGAIPFTQIDTSRARIGCQCSKLIHSPSQCTVTQPRSVCRYKSKRSSSEQNLRVSERRHTEIRNEQLLREMPPQQTKTLEVFPPARGRKKGHVILGQELFSRVKSLRYSDYPHRINAATLSLYRVCNNFGLTYFFTTLRGDISGE